MTRREKFTEILKNNGIYGEDPEDILNAVSEMFEFEVKYTKKMYPYATNSIRNEEQVVHETWEMTNVLDDELEE